MEKVEEKPASEEKLSSVTRPTQKEKRSPAPITQKKQYILKKPKLKPKPTKKPPGQRKLSNRSKWEAEQPVLEEVLSPHRSPRRSRAIPWVEVLRSPKPSLEEIESQEPQEEPVHLLTCHSITSVQRLMIKEADLPQEHAESLPSLTKLSLGAVVPGMGRDIAADVNPTQSLMQLMDLLRVPTGRDRKTDKYYDRISTPEESIIEEESSESTQKCSPSICDEMEPLPHYSLEAEILLEEMDAAAMGKRAFDPDWRKTVRQDRDLYHQRWIPQTRSYEDWEGPEGICICVTSDVGHDVLQLDIPLPKIKETDEKLLEIRDTSKNTDECDTRYADPEHQIRRTSGGIDYTSSEVDDHQLTKNN